MRSISDVFSTIGMHVDPNPLYCVVHQMLRQLSRHELHTLYGIPVVIEHAQTVRSQCYLTCGFSALCASLIYVRSCTCVAIVERVCTHTVYLGKSATQPRPVPSIVPYVMRAAPRQMRQVVRHSSRIEGGTCKLYQRDAAAANPQAML